MEYKLSALIVDDEESARKLLNKLLEETLYFSEIRVASSVNSALEELNQFDPDLIFLDIKMPGKDGFSFIDELPEKQIKPVIVFVTAYDQYAIKAIKNEAFDYILKPVNRKELRQCVVKYASRKSNSNNIPKKDKTLSASEKIPRIKVNTKTGTLFINPSSVLYCKAEGNYTLVCTGEKKHLCSMNIGKVEILLKSDAFIRLGRSYILNFEHITLIDRKESIVTLTRNNETATVKIPKRHLKELDAI
jgi:two-component system, LytTR family, response regulator